MLAVEATRIRIRTFLKRSRTTILVIAARAPDDPGGCLPPPADNCEPAKALPDKIRHVQRENPAGLGRRFPVLLAGLYGGLVCFALAEHSDRHLVDGCCALAFVYPVTSKNHGYGFLYVCERSERNGREESRLSQPIDLVRIPDAPERSRRKRPVWRPPKRNNLELFNRHVLR